ncbi:MAG: alpha-amylase family protein [Microbacteriaceae bacterium]
MRISETGDRWWKTAVFYNLDVKTYLDWNGDGIGDFEGLANRLDYLADLGVTCLWLAPFYPSPRRDNGYDISDYYGVHPDHGHLGDFVEFVRTAKDRGMRIIVDLVVNHTSQDHPWFQASREDPEGEYGDFYLWRDEEPDDDTENMFPDVEDGVWSQDEASGRYYRHTFYRHQPDLNTDSARVREEIEKVLGFWLQIGADGFRVDAVPYLIESEQGREHDFLRSLRGALTRRQGSAMMLGEVNLPYDEQLEFFGGEDGDELTMQFDFVGNQALWLSMARQDAGPLRAALRSRPPLATGNQWGNFVRNHDELTLDQLSEEERNEVFDAFAPEQAQRIHDRGIVRRAPGMLESDPRRLRLLYSLAYSLPGAPVLYYGEEIGLIENGDIPGRSAVRTPMQWTDGEHGGFAPAGTAEIVAPQPGEGAAPAQINVSDQLRDEGSLLAFHRRLIAAYRTSPEIGWGELTVLETGHDCVLAHRLTLDGADFVAVHNLAAHGRSVELALDGVVEGTEVASLLDPTVQPEVERGGLRLELDGYGALWLRLVAPGSRRLH